MIRTRAWHAWIFCCCSMSGLGIAPRAAHAAPSASAIDERSQPIDRVEVAMLGDVDRDPLLFERIHSLFPSETAVILREDQELDQRAVLLPQRADTVYLWIRVTERSAARVYLAMSEPDGQARYLFREVRLDSGLDEVGGETLAEVAHSSARALWLHEQQSSRESLIAALEREPETPRAAEAGAPAALAPISTATGRDSAESVPRSSEKHAERREYLLGVGASGVTHSSGTEGWLQEVGAFFAFEYRGQLSLRAALRYLVPTDFGLPPARVHLNGATGELRGGWLSSDATRIRVRLEAGLGVLFGHAQASIIDEQPRAHALAGQDFQRAYALAAGGVELPFGPAWVALGADLRVPLRTTSYEVGGQSGASTSCSLCPGGTLEVGIGFDPAPR